MNGPAPRNAARGGGMCTFCGMVYADVPNQCSRCGTLLGDAALDAKRVGARARRLHRTRKALADVFFLVGLLLGGPMMTVGGEVRLGLFIVLAGGLASILRRHTDWSSPGTVLVGGCAAAVVASLVLGGGHEPGEGTATREEARLAFAEALARKATDGLVEARGPAAITIWFTLPAQLSGACGDYPPSETREHMRDLGFMRVVVSGQNPSRGICSFRP